MNSISSTVRPEFDHTLKALLSPEAPAYPELGKGYFITVQVGWKRVAHFRCAKVLHILTYITAREKGRAERGKAYSISEYAYSAITEFITITSGPKNTWNSAVTEWMTEGIRNTSKAKIAILLTEGPCPSRMGRLALIAQLIKDQDYRKGYFDWLGRELDRHT